MRKGVLRNAYFAMLTISMPWENTCFDSENISLEAQLAFEVLQSLDQEYLKSSTPPVSSLPEWWVPANSAEDSIECDLIQDLLNRDDFQDMMQKLAMRAHNFEEGSTVLVWWKVQGQGRGTGGDGTHSTSFRQEQDLGRCWWVEQRDCGGCSHQV